MRAKDDTAAQAAVREPAAGARRPIEAIIAEVERTGGRVALSGASLDVKTAMLGAGKQDVAELKSRSREAIGYLAGKRMPPRLPKSGSFPRSQLMPLSVAQDQLAHIDRVPVQEQWLPFLWRMEGLLNLPAFTQAYLGVLARHEILRTRYVAEGSAMRQEIMPADQQRLDVVDLTGLPETERELEIYNRIRPIFLKPTPLSDGVLRLKLYRIAERTWILGGFVHHIAFDARSITLFLMEIKKGYYWALGGTEQPVVPPLQYADFALWENSWLTDEEKSLAGAWWEYALAGAAPMAIPGGRKASDPPAKPGAAPFELPKAVFQSAEAFARENGATLNMMFLAMLSLALGRWAGQGQALFANLVQGRPVGFETVMGCFMQARPLHIAFGDDPTIAELLARARKAVIAASDIRKPVPIELLTRLGVANVAVNYVLALGPDGMARLENLGGSPAPQRKSALVSPFARPAHPSLSALTGEPGADFRVKGKMAPLPVRLQTEFSRDLHFGVTQTPTSLAGRITFALGRIEPAHVMSLSRDVAMLFALAVGSPERRVLELMRTTAQAA